MAADTSGESSYSLGAVGLVKIRAVASLKELNLVKANGDLKKTCVLNCFILVMTYIKNKYSLLFGITVLLFLYCVDFQFYLIGWRQ